MLENNLAEGDAWDAGKYAAVARFVGDAGAGLVDWLAPRPGERILDLGCGDGELGLQLQALGAEVVGLDASPSMVEAARNRGLDACLGRAEALEYVDAFDAVFSNAALHWVPQAEAVLAGVARALRPGGRLVVEQGGAGNVETVRRALVAELSSRHGVDTDLSDIWYFPDEAAHRAKLETAGFEIEQMILFERPTPIASDMKAWLQTLAGAVLAKLPNPERDSFAYRVSEQVAPQLQAADGSLVLDYVRLRYAARLAVTP